MSMELVMNNEELTWKIFSRLTELRDILRAEEGSREWHALMQNDRVWEPLCRRYAGKGLDTGFGMLAALKARPECRLSWRQLFVQRAYVWLWLLPACTAIDSSNALAPALGLLEFLGVLLQL